MRRTRRDWPGRCGTPRQGGADPTLQGLFHPFLSLCGGDRALCQVVRANNPETAILVDNCYGEFVETLEPTQAGADLVVGSLIKNPGGGLAPTGGYIAGRRDLVEGAAMRLSTPGIGKECGSTFGANRSSIKGFSLPPIPRPRQSRRRCLPPG